MELHETERLCTEKCSITQTKIFTYYTFDRGLSSKICEELKNLDIKKPNNPTKKWYKDINREFPERTPK